MQLSPESFRLEKTNEPKNLNNLLTSRTLATVKFRVLLSTRDNR